MNGNFDQAVAVISTTAARWEQMARSIPVELFSRKPVKEEWSALECLVHLIDVEEIMQSRMQAFLNGEQKLPAFDPDKEGTKVGENINPADLAAKFSTRRAEGLEALKAVKPSDLARSSVHAELGLVTLLAMINEWAGHDLNHTMQAERAMIQPFIDGCGAWRVYFKHHQF